MRATHPLLALAWLLHCAVGAGVFELQILEFSNHRLQLSSGACCGGAGRSSVPCATPCRTRFELCLKEYQSVPVPGACSFGRAASPVLGTDSFTLAEPLYTLALPFSFRWTRSVTLILQAYDDFNYTDPEESGVIEEAWWSGIVEPARPETWHALRHAGAAASLAYRVRVLCQPNHYNTTCTTFCRPRDDKFGHYACSADGDKHCLPGWQGDNCEIPLCKEGCHPTHGRCDRPGECLCRPGWRGELCAQCQPYPGCKHGYCNGSSWDCTCNTNWGGILCDQDLNYCGTHEPCQHGGTCENTAPDQYLCTCAEGFSGAECERVDNPCAPQPCAHGACALAAAVSPGYTCACEPGWGGARCDHDIDDCASAPCRHGATCYDQLDGFRCACAPGWQGPTCSDDVDECSVGSGPCVNAASCTNTGGSYACTCLAGWTGRDCDTNIDDCSGQCLNGATCIDLVNDFHCACAGGWAGRTCARDVDECASHPCRHGGECVDLLDAYRCICPVGFTGTDCEDDRDHCAGAPCANGAPCYTAQNDYYCHCAPGWTGKNCTQRALRERPSVGVDGGEECPGGCGAGGSCAGGAGGARCVCRAGWAGARCDTEINQCASAPCQNNGTCVNRLTDFTCICRDGWTGKMCSALIEDDGRCGVVTCSSGATCVREMGGAGRCVCPPARTGAACDEPLPVVALPDPCGGCLHGGSCDGRACLCHEGWTGARCERSADACAGAPCRNGGRCVGGAGWRECECAPGWTGPDCVQPAPAPPAPLAPLAPPRSCTPPCPAPARCTPDPERVARCVCPASPSFAGRRCLELIAGLVSEEEELGDREEWGVEGLGSACGSRNGTWWWGCNACWCGGGTAACTRLWCGLPDCLAAGAQPCRGDEVCVPAAPALCLRPPCAPLGECHRVAGRRVEPPALPAPAGCWPGVRSVPPGCARARLQLARERLAPGAHAERGCAALRRALAVALASRAPPAPPAPPLVLMCDLAPDDDDELELALWNGDEDGVEGAVNSKALASAMRTLSELVSRRRVAQHALLGAALRLHVEQPAEVPESRTSGSALALVLGPLLAVAAGAGAAGAVFAVRRRRAAAAERLRRRDEEKSNNLQNEENLRRYANPLRDERGAAGGAELPRSLYKAPNADARNNTHTGTPAPRDKRAPPEPPAPAARPLRPPERLTVVV